jgi:hypothetical protein
MLLARLSITKPERGARMVSRSFGLRNLRDEFVVLKSVEKVLVAAFLFDEIAN